MLNILLFNATNHKFYGGANAMNFFQAVELDDIKNVITKRLKDLNVSSNITLDSKIDEKTDLDQFDIILCGLNTKRYLDLSKIKKAKVIEIKYEEYAKVDFDQLVNEILAA